MIEVISLENFKGTTDQVKLDQLNIFRGTSGSGKSTWLEAVRVAILGHEPGYGKLLAETMSLSSGGGMSVKVTHKDVSVMRVFSTVKGKDAQTIFVNGESMTAKAAEPELAKHFGKFPMMLNPDEFFSMSNDKKITFLFGLSDTETDSEVLRRKCILAILGTYTEAVEYILEYEIKPVDLDPFLLDEGSFSRLVALSIDKLAEKDAPSGRALTKIFNELLRPESALSNGQETLAMYASTLRTEINATRRSKQDAEAANRKLIEEKAEKMKLLNYNEEENNSEIEKLRAAISEIEKELHSRDKLKSAKERLLSGVEVHAAAIEKSNKEIPELNKLLLSEEQLKESAEIMASLEKNRKELTEKIDSAREKWNALDEKIKAVRVPEIHCPNCQGEIECPTCQAGGKEEIKKRKKKVKSLSEKADEIMAYLESLGDALEANESDMKKLSLTMNTHEDNRTKYDVAVKHQENLEALLKEEKKNLDNIEEPGADTDILQTSLKAQKVSLGERLVAEKNHQWLRTLEGTIASSNETIYNSEAQISALAASERSVKDVRDELTQAATGVVEKACNGLLEKVRKDFSLTYDIEDGKFDIRCVNVNGETVAFKTLSGGEKVLYLSAQLLALMTIVNPKLKVLEVEMGELSGDLVPPFMKALKEMTKGTDVQVILSSCHTDFKVADKAWAVHQMGE